MPPRMLMSCHRAHWTRAAHSGCVVRGGVGSGRQVEQRPSRVEVQQAATIERQAAAAAAIIEQQAAAMGESAVA